MQKTPRPDSVSVKNDGSSLRLVYYWFTWRAVYTLVIAFIWNFVFWTGFAPGILRGSNGFEIFPFAYISYAFMIAGVGIAYYALASVFNWTVITTDRVELKIRHMPFPWLGNRTMLCSDLQQLYCEEIIGSMRSGGRYFQLNAISPDNRKITLLSRVSEAGAAIFIEKEVETYLGIRDERVAGEYGHK